MRGETVPDAALRVANRNRTRLILLSLGNVPNLSCSSLISDSTFSNPNPLLKANPLSGANTLENDAVIFKASCHISFRVFIWVCLRLKKPNDQLKLCSSRFKVLSQLRIEICLNQMTSLRTSRPGPTSSTFTQTEDHLLVGAYEKPSLLPERSTYSYCALAVQSS